MTITGDYRVETSVRKIATMLLGPIEIASPFCQAGLAGYSDRAMRLVARRRGCAYAVTEALLDVIMLAGGQGLKKSIDINDEDHPLAGQIIGSEPETMSAAAAILKEHHYDVIDFNYACPVKKIKNKARGGHMLRDLSRGVDIFRAVRQKVGDAQPLSVSLRRSFDHDPAGEEVLYALLDEAWQQGFVAARVHGRTVEQKYLGRADWSSLRRLKERYPERMIIGSGDVFTAGDAVRMKVETGVDMVWIARGAIGNPWIFADAQRLLAATNDVNSQPVELVPPTVFQQRAALEEHFAEAMAIHGEQVAGRRMRKMGIKYARFHPLAENVRRDFINVVSMTDWARVIERWYTSDDSGIWPAADESDEVNPAADVATVSDAEERR